MVQIFAKVLDMSLTASLVIGVVLILRLLLRRAPKVWSYALWSVVLFRLLCPVSFESGLSVLRREVRVEVGEQTLAVYEAMEPGQTGDAALRAVGDALNGGLDTITVRLEPGHEVSEERGSNYGALYHDEVWLLVFSRLWPVGVVLMAGRGILSLCRLRRRLKGAVSREANVFEVEGLETAFVMGLVVPEIYLPAGLSGEERACVLCHERHHIRRGDHVLKLLAFAALCVHWFNPLVWLAFTLAGKDMEMSCDEAVMKQMGEGSRKAYSQSLLNLATGRRMSVGTPLAFGEGDTKGRIKNVLNWKKPKIWVSILAMLVCAVAICACAADPVEPQEPAENENVQQGSVNSWRQGVAFAQLAPGETAFSEQLIVLVEDDSRVDYHITYSRTGLNLEVGLQCEDGTEYTQTVAGGVGKASIEELPAGRYTPFVRNVDQGYPTEPDATGVVNFDLTGSGDYFEAAQPMESELTGSDEPVSEDVPQLPDDAQIIGQLPGNISLTPMLYEAILDHHRSQYSGDNFCCASFVVLDNYLDTRMHPVTGEDLSTMDYFLWVLYQEYQFTEDGIVDMGGTHIPTNITLAENGDGSWSVLNYWEPRDGSYYVEDIQTIFPEGCVDNALDSQKYICGQMQDCYAQAVSYAQTNGIDLNTDQIISDLLDTICASDADSGHHGSDHHQLSSSHHDHISAHPIEYRELLYYGHHTLDYCRRHLENMGLEGDGPAELGLRERIMEQLLADLSV